MDTTTELNGEYRIRGLQPLQEYQLVVQLPSGGTIFANGFFFPFFFFPEYRIPNFDDSLGDFVRMQPTSYTFTTGNKDVTNKDFVLFKKFPKYALISLFSLNIPSH
jgi:hypothetical protein